MGRIIEQRLHLIGIRRVRARVRSRESNNILRHDIDVRHETEPGRAPTVITRAVQTQILGIVGAEPIRFGGISHTGLWEVGRGQDVEFHGTAVAGGEESWLTRKLCCVGLQCAEFRRRHPRAVPVLGEAGDRCDVLVFCVAVGSVC